MRFEVPAISACVLLSCASLALSQEAFVEEADRNFPREVTVRHGDTDYQLTVTGTAVRKKFIVKVYAMAHYMEVAEFADRDAAFEAARSGKHASQITMEFTRGVGSEKIRNAYREGFEKNSSEDDFSELEPLVALFLSYFGNDIEENDRIVLRRFPDGTVETVVAGEEMDSLKGELFASVLWDIWFGDDSPVDRKKLVKLTYEEE